MGVGEKRLAEARLHAWGLSGAACRNWVEGTGEWTGRRPGRAGGRFVVATVLQKDITRMAICTSGEEYALGYVSGLHGRAF